MSNYESMKDLVAYLKWELKLYEKNLATLKNEPVEKVEKTARRIVMRENEVNTLKTAIRKLEGRKDGKK